MSLALADGTRPTAKMTPATAAVRAPLIAFFILIHLTNSQLKSTPTLVRYDRTQHQAASALHYLSSDEKNIIEGSWTTYYYRWQGRSRYFVRLSSRECGWNGNEQWSCDFRTRPSVHAEVLEMSQACRTQCRACGTFCHRGR